MSREIIKTCQRCKKEFWGKNKLFCSKDCSNKSRGYREETHPSWKGDRVGYGALHGWVKRYLKKPQTCRDCNQSKPLDLANISQEYKRDLSDWEWLCRSCHMKKDGRLGRFKEAGQKYLKSIITPPQMCVRCYKLRKHKGRGLCISCFDYARKRKLLHNWKLTTGKSQLKY